MAHFNISSPNTPNRSTRRPLYLRQPKPKISPSISKPYSSVNCAVTSAENDNNAKPRHQKPAQSPQAEAPAPPPLDKPVRRMIACVVLIRFCFAAYDKSDPIISRRLTTAQSSLWCRLGLVETLTISLARAHDRVVN